MKYVIEYFNKDGASVGFEFSGIAVSDMFEADHFSATY